MRPHWHDDGVRPHLPARADRGTAVWRHFRVEAYDLVGSKPSADVTNQERESAMQAYKVVGDAMRTYRLEVPTTGVPQS
jgi:hypothetical protein